MPKISVIVAVNNGETYLPDALDSILGQTFADFEVLIVDDGSTDNTKQVILDYIRLDSRIKIIESLAQHSVGLTRCLNHLLKFSESEYIARMDADDICLPHRFERQLQYMRDRPSVVCLGSAVEHIDSAGESLRIEINPCEHAEIERQLLCGIGGSLRHPTAFIRRKALHDIGAYCEKYRTAQDLDLYLRLARVGELANTQEILLRYRIHAQSTNFSRTDQQDLDVDAMLRHAYRVRSMRYSRKSIAWRFSERMDRRLVLAQAARERRDKLQELKFVIQAIQAAPWRRRGYYFLAECFVGKEITRKLAEIGGVK